MIIILDSRAKRRGGELRARTRSSGTQTAGARRFGRRAAQAAALAAALAASAGCDGDAFGGGGGTTVVASFYPLAWAAERVGGSAVEVVDLTPAGGEAHDATLSARHRAQIASADLMIVLGQDGFQPEVEEAARDRSGDVLEAAEGIEVLPGEEAGAADPHVWLDPLRMAEIVERVGDALGELDPGGREVYVGRAREAVSDLEALHEEFESGLRNCRFTTMVVTHEAFGYLADRYGLEQLGIAGLSPEGEPLAGRLTDVADAVRGGDAGAVFYEETDEGQRVSESVAADLDVPALPLATLESAPEEGDYLSRMRENLAALRSGLDCR